MKSLRHYAPWFILLLSLLGAAISLYLTILHYKALGGISLDEVAFCTFGKSFNCIDVTTSKFSKIFGYPVSSLGLAQYLGIGVLALFMKINPERFARQGVAGIIVLVCLALIGDLYLGSMLVFRLKIYCLFCLATYVLNFFILVLAIWGVDPSLKVKSVSDVFQRVIQALCSPFQKEDGRWPWKPLLAWLVLIFFMALSVGTDRLIYAKYPPAPKNNHGNDLPPKFDKEKFRSQYCALPVMNEDFELEGSPSHGPENAQVTIVEFSDFECPHCQKASQLFRPFMMEFKEEVRFVFKHYPLDQSCNPKITRKMHEKACMFAKATLCARQQPPRDLFWEMHDAIFEKTQMLDETNIAQEAKNIGLDPDLFSECLGNEKIEELISKDIELGEKLGINSTPSIFINGRKLPGLLHPIAIRAIIEIELEGC